MNFRIQRFWRRLGAIAGKARVDAAAPPANEAPVMNFLRDVVMHAPVGWVQKRIPLLINP